MYVNNRVQRIQKSTRPEQWKHVPTDQNPADQATRSVLAADLSHSMWLTGPKFLFTMTPPETDTGLFGMIDPEVDIEVRPQVVLVLHILQARSWTPNALKDFQAGDR